MNNYSWWQQKLHQFALSSNFMREATFDVESSIIEVNQIQDNHVFVAGLARSGTTILLNAIHKSNEFASLSYMDMPFVLAPNLWSKLSLHRQSADLIQRAHGDGIKISQDSPEAFEEVFWMSFDEREKHTKEKFRNYVQRINRRYQMERYLSKNNQNIKRLKLISEIFPNSKLLIPFRNPLQQAFSLLSQHQRFIDYSKKDMFISKYMAWIGHSEFGTNYIPIYNKELKFLNHLDINHWLEQWCLTYQKCFEDFNGKENIYFISYEKLCSSKKYWFDILQKLDIKTTFDFEFKESYKEISLDIDEEIMSHVLSLYSKLSQLQLN